MPEMILRLNEEDTTVTKSLERLRTGGKQVISESNGLNDLASMTAGDTLYIIGHGDEHSIGGRKPSEMAKLLIDNDFKSGISITLVPCDRGTGRMPYALELKTHLASKKIISTTITGGTDYMQVDANGSLNVACNE